MTVQDMDQKLISSICQGEEDAIGQLYDRYGKVMMTTAYHLLNNKSDAEDLLHDVFLEVWRTAKSYDPERGSVLSWLMVKLRSRALDRRRYRLHRTALELFEAEDQTQNPCEHWLSKDENDVLDEALKALPEAQRTVMLLCYYRGLTYQEIASYTDVSVGTVKSRLATAKTRLKQVLILHVGVNNDS
ncbi:MAG: sigma-70 family RNA polymerase sigma factor [Candidatus Thiodiazotropha sp.]